jgi:hypothetical protein
MLAWFGATLSPGKSQATGIEAGVEGCSGAVAVVESVNRKPTDVPPGVTTALSLAAARFEAATIKPANPDDRPFVGLLYTGGSQMHAGAPCGN